MNEILGVTGFSLYLADADTAPIGVDYVHP